MARCNWRGCRARAERGSAFCAEHQNVNQAPPPNFTRDVQATMWAIIDRVESRAEQLKWWIGPGSRLCPKCREPHAA